MFVNQKYYNFETVRYSNDFLLDFTHAKNVLILSHYLYVHVTTFQVDTV